MKQGACHLTAPRHICPRNNPQKNLVFVSNVKSRPQTDAIFVLSRCIQPPAPRRAALRSRKDEKATPLDEIGRRSQQDRIARTAVPTPTAPGARGPCDGHADAARRLRLRFTYPYPVFRPFFSTKGSRHAREAPFAWVSTVSSLPGIATPDRPDHAAQHTSRRPQCRDDPLRAICRCRTRRSETRSVDFRHDPRRVICFFQFPDVSLLDRARLRLDQASLRDLRKSLVHRSCERPV